MTRMTDAGFASNAAIILETSVGRVRECPLSTPRRGRLAAFLQR